MDLKIVLQEKQSHQAVRGIHVEFSVRTPEEVDRVIEVLRIVRAALAAVQQKDPE